MTTGSSEFVVVDASIAIKWLVDEEDSDLAQILIRSWATAGTQLAAPHLMPYEVSNALHRKVTEGLMTSETAAGFMEDLMAHQVELYEAHRTYGAALQLAANLNQRAIYDSHYLALAQALNCEFWTADERFYRSANPDHANVRLISEGARSG